MTTSSACAAAAAGALPLFSLLDVEKRFPLDGGRRELRALDGIRLALGAGESLALVGESGSGKSTLVRVMLGLEPASNGRVMFRGGEPGGADRAARRRFARDVAYIYQDARGSLNPRLTVAELLSEPIRLHGLRDAAEIPGRVDELIARVGLPTDVRSKVPAELSGGQVRRVAVARALAGEPRVIVADESVAGLDVSVQAQLLNLLRDLQREQGLAMLFVTHDLGVAAYLCERVAVMYLGRIVELGLTRDVLARPLHPYTRALMQAFPRFDAPLTVSLSGEIPNAAALPAGCRFRSRCSRAQADCEAIDPVQRGAGEGRQVACLHPLAALDGQEA